MEPKVGIVCGTGCGGIADTLVNAQVFKFEDIPHFIQASIQGHKGLLHIGTLQDKTVVLLQGRLHAYEGYHSGQAAFPIRVMKQLGVSSIIITSATGGLNPIFKIGDLMVVKDHLSFPSLSGGSSLEGPNDSRLGERFVAQNNAYDRDLRKLAKDVAQNLGFGSFVREGNLIHVMGPAYETPLECKFLQMIGGDVVGMSNANECLVARHMNVKVLSITLITNMCVLDVDKDGDANHEEVLNAAKTRVKDLQQFVSHIVTKL